MSKKSLSLFYFSKYKVPSFGLQHLTVKAELYWNLNIWNQNHLYCACFWSAPAKEISPLPPHYLLRDDFDIKRDLLSKILLKARLVGLGYIRDTVHCFFLEILPPPFIFFLSKKDLSNKAHTFLEKVVMITSDPSVALWWKVVIQSSWAMNALWPFWQIRPWGEARTWD